MPSRITRQALARLAAATDLKPINRVEPEFPREAMATGANEGMVRTRLTLDGSGGRHARGNPGV